MSFQEKRRQHRGTNTPLATGIVAIIIAVAAIGYAFVGPTSQLNEVQGQVTSIQTQLANLNKLVSSVQAQQTSSVQAQQNAVNDLQGKVSSLLSQVNSLSSLQTQVSGLKTQVSDLQAVQRSLPMMNQTPTTRLVKVEWLEGQSGQDRFYPSLIVVNQGDKVALTVICNDTDAHTLTLGTPYSFNINATLPGMKNDLTGKLFTTSPTNNSPGVKVWGTIGNQTATGSFVAKYAGVYEFVCVYHAEKGMVGYLIVLPNAGYRG